MRKCGSSFPMTMTKVSEDPKADTLLCYKTMGVFIDYAGKLTGRSLEWLSGPVERIVLSLPYILVASPRLIEVRLAATGKLMQTIAAPDVFRITGDGRDGTVTGGDSGGSCGIQVILSVKDWQILFHLDRRLTT